MPRGCRGWTRWPEPEGRVYVAWDELDVDLGALPDRQGLIRVMEDRFPDEKAKALVNWSSQVW